MIPRSDLFSAGDYSHMQVTVAILLNSFVGAITAAEEEEAESAASTMKSKEMLRLDYIHNWPGAYIVLN
jgi:hypothetical protein